MENIILSLLGFSLFFFSQACCALYDDGSWYRGLVAGINSEESIEVSFFVILLHPGLLICMNLLSFGGNDVLAKENFRDDTGHKLPFQLALWWLLNINTCWSSLCLLLYLLFVFFHLSSPPHPKSGNYVIVGWLVSIPLLPPVLQSLC